MKIGIADTMFSRVDMFQFAQRVISHSEEDIIIERYTVPGIKDLPVACKILFEGYGCDIVIALGMPGPLPVDKQCSHEASIGMQQCMLMVNKHILEVFVHMDEAKSDAELSEICKERTMKHTENAIALVKGKDTLRPYAGQGKRQGKEDVGPVEVEK